MNSHPARSDATAPAARVSWSAWGADLWALAKPEISFLVTLSAAAGFVLGAPDGPLPLLDLAVTLTGVFLTAGGAGVLNHYAERSFDAQMKRTQDRALPAGRVAPCVAFYYGIALVAAGVGLLCPLVGPTVAALALLTATLYVFVYTPLKRQTTLNTLVGTVPGALPALGGYAAAVGGFGGLTAAGGWAIFAVLACWQMPHFLSLAWMYRKDYTRGGYAMTSGDDPTGLRTSGQAAAFCVLLLVASVLPYAIGDAGGLYLAGALVLGVWFLFESLRFLRERTGQRARALLKVSIYYVPLLFAFILADWWIA